jgi:serine/threonine protein kinase
MFERRGLDASRLPPDPSQPSTTASESDQEIVPEWLRRVAKSPPLRHGPLLVQGTLFCQGRYRIERAIGRGGMGAVYQAWDATREQHVALKTLLEGSASAIYGLKQEFRSLVRVRHPNLVALHELFEDAGRWCFTMQLVPGQTLRVALPDLAPSSLVTVFKQLVEGIQVIHAAGKLHRDIKPSNAMLTPNGRVVVLDFGLVADVAGADAGRVRREFSGTPAYLSPEQAAGKAATPESDWYALGVILFEALARRLPFSGGSESMLRDKQRSEAPALGAYAPHAPPVLAELCRRLLSRDPELRPRATEISQLLERSSEGESPLTVQAIGLASPEPAEPVSGGQDASLLGRDSELELLRDAFVASRRGTKPVVVLVSGESGIGKTRLCEGFVQNLSGTLVLSGSCYERESLPFKAFDALVDGLSRYLSGLPPQALATLVPRGAAALATLFPVLEILLTPSTRAQPATPTARDPRELRTEAFRALGELLGELSARTAVVLYIDDLHWSDADSTLLLLHLLRDASAPRLLLLAAHRSEDSVGNACLEPLYEVLPKDIRLDVRRLELGPLGRPAAEALLDRQGAIASTELLEQARGNPFLLQELARDAASTRELSSRKLSLAETILRRVAQLSVEQRRALELVALAGRPLSEAFAKTAWQASEWHDTLDALVTARLLRSRAGSGDIACYHDKIREAVAASVPQPASRRYHRRLARATLADHSRDPEHLALHLAGAGHPRRAADQTLVAARRAEASLAFGHAAQLYGRALALGTFKPEREQALRVARADAHAAAGHGLESVELYLGALERAEASNKVELQHRAAEQCLYSGRIERGLSLLRDALQPSRVRVPKTLLGTLILFVYLRLRLALRGHGFQARPVSGELAEHIKLLQRASRALAGVDGLQALVLGLQAFLLALDAGHASAVSYGVVGELWMGLLFDVRDQKLAELGLRAERACERSRGAEERSLLHIVSASLAFMRPSPSFDEALRELDLFFEVQKQNVLPGFYHQIAWARYNRAHVLGHLGRVSEVARDVPAELDAAWARGDLSLVPMWAGGFPALARLAVGDVAGTEQALERATAAWTVRQVTFQDLSLFTGAFTLHSYRGNARAAWESVVRCRARLRASPMGHSTLAKNLLESMRARGAVALAAELGNTQERAALLRLARSVARGRRPRATLVAALRSHFVDAALACQSGDAAAAAAALERGIADVAAVPLYFHAARRLLGVVLGGERGRELVASSDAFFEANGAVDIERVVAAIFPGCELR